MGRKALPYDAEIEYLETNAEGGNCLINTEYIVNGRDNDIYITLELLGPVRSINQIIAGAGEYMYYHAYGVFVSTSPNVIRLSNGGDAANTTHITISYNTKYNITLLHDFTYQINEETGILSDHNYGGPDKYPLVFFSNSENPKSNDIRIYSFKLVKNGKVLFDMIPVRVGDEGFLYNKVSRKLYGNSGTGKFILGPDIN